MLLFYFKILDIAKPVIPCHPGILRSFSEAEYPGSSWFKNLIFSEKLKLIKIEIMKKEEKVPTVYILTNKPDGVLYTGVTSDLKSRIWQHKQEVIEGFTQKYNIKMLVYYEILPDMENAILREKRLKR